MDPTYQRARRTNRKTDPGDVSQRDFSAKTTGWIFILFCEKMNTLSLRNEPDASGDIRVWVYIDGEKMFQVGIECLEDCFLTRDPVADPYLKNVLLNSESEKIIDYGFCVEGCCESTVAEIRYSRDAVSWRSVRPSIADVPDEPREYTFDRQAYDIEINRCIAAMTRHLSTLYRDLRYPPNKAEGAAQSP